MTNYERELTERIRGLVAHTKRLVTWWPWVCAAFTVAAFAAGMWIARMNL